MAERSWYKEYEAACSELKAAEAQYKQAISIHDGALARLNGARATVARLFCERIKTVNTNVEG